MRPTLRFRLDGTFTIVQITDVHWRDGGPKDQRSASLIREMLGIEQPDMVALTGDTFNGQDSTNAANAYRQVMAPFDEAGIPWAAVFGNHDDEGDLTRAELLDVLQESPNCLTEAGPHGIGGVGNFVVPIWNSEGRAQDTLLYFLDSGGYAPDPPGGYAWITKEQIAWLTSDLALRRRSTGTVLPAQLFFHIPLPEFDELWDQKMCIGVKYEEVACPRTNSGLFGSLVEAEGVQGCFVGHDHVNDFDGELDGIRLCYGRATGFNTYGHERMSRGARVIRLTAGEPGFATWIRVEGGAKIVNGPLHSPCGRVLSKGDPPDGFRV